MHIHYTTYQLDNGLRVIVQEEPAVSKVAVDILYRVGSADESPTRTGLAHLFEHLMFSGSKHVPDYDTHVQRVGGENNAFTNSDITNYYLTLPASQLETAFWLESDRMLELDFSEENLAVQRSVVMEEFKQRYLNQPYGDAYLQLRPVHFRFHPYNWMTIGKDLSHVEHTSLQDIKDFFYRFYAPNNATLVVSGGIKAAEVMRLAEKWFGPIPARDVKRPKRVKEPWQAEARQISVEREVPFDAVYRAYPCPARTDEAYYAADMITDLLTGSKSGRLYQRMVKETRVASQVSAFSWGLYDPGMISIEGRVAEGRTVAEYEAVLDEVLAEFDQLTPEELTRMQNKIESQEVFNKTTVLNRAMSLALFDSLGRPELINTEAEAYRRLSVDDVLAARQHYLQPSQATTLHYLRQR
ncbi:MAG: insulinase family protein [Bacteroidetes bacterium]|jgi:predicted Zn-dependent peptidase|nr:insulinase family protein [Bacteroidota bacterium]